MSEADAATLAVDCGGGTIKSCILDAAGTMHTPVVRTPTPYPLPPAKLVSTIRTIAQGLPQAGRITVGLPGMIRHGVVIHTPHYINKAGPHTKVEPELAQLWAGFDMAAAISQAMGIPTLVLNDAQVHGAGVIAGAGVELVVTLGTGLGNALFDGGRLAPHLELSQAPARWGLTYDEYIGEHERQRLGDAAWSRRVRWVFDGLRPVYLWDRLYIGGGNSRAINATTLSKLGDDVVVVPNSAGMVGGVRAWTLINQM